jgi:hypothetical protein
MGMATKGRKSRRQTRAAVAPSSLVLLLRGFAASQEFAAICDTDSRNLPASQQGDNPDTMQEMATPQCSDRKFAISAFKNLLSSSKDMFIVSPQWRNTRKKAERVGAPVWLVMVATSCA